MGGIKGAGIYCPAGSAPPRRRRISKVGTQRSRADVNRKMESTRIKVDADADRTLLDSSEGEPSYRRYATLRHCGNRMRATVSDAEQESEVLQLLHRLDLKLDGMIERVDDSSRRADTTEGVERLAGVFVSAVQGLRGQLQVSEKRLAEEIAKLGDALAAYHATAIGNGARFDALDARVRRLEELVGVSSPEP